MIRSPRNRRASSLTAGHTRATRRGATVPLSPRPEVAACPPVTICRASHIGGVAKKLPPEARNRARVAAPAFAHIFAFEIRGLVGEAPALRLICRMSPERPENAKKSRSNGEKRRVCD